MTTRTPISFIATDAPEAAERFYGQVMGLRLVEASPFALVFDDQGAMLRVQIVEALEPVAYTVHGWQRGAWCLNSLACRDRRRAASGPARREQRLRGSGTQAGMCCL